ncbi:MAG TPA: prolyl oligopeptidase family serine peptidase, partial [bacterium]|nr:prolyl oligopeptidase family serine peptidase [bacterium]
MRRIFTVALVFGAMMLFAASNCVAQSVFEKHKADFDYDKSQPLNPEVKVLEERENYVKYHVFYNSANGERVPAFLYVPKNIKKYAEGLSEEYRKGYDRRAIEQNGPPWPVIFFMHWLQSDKSLADGFAPKWALYGYAVLAIDGIHKGEREKPGRNILEFNPNDTRQNIVQQVIDSRRGLDYLASRPDIDMKRCAYFGISMGSLTGAVATAVDDRFKVVVLADGAGDLATVFNKAELPEFKETVNKIQDLGYTLD